MYINWDRLVFHNQLNHVYTLFVLLYVSLITICKYRLRVESLPLLSKGVTSQLLCPIVSNREPLLPNNSGNQVMSWREGGRGGEFTLFYYACRTGKCELQIADRGGDGWRYLTHVWVKWCRWGFETLTLL